MASSSWSETIDPYFDKRLLWVFMLGCSSGFPWVLIGSNMTAWLADAKIERATIGFFGAVFTVYAINFLWAPLIDRVKIPFLYNCLGLRRSWILLCQSVILIGCVFLSLLNPANDLILMSALALLISTMSATQDIAIDAFRIDSFPKSDKTKLPQASAMAVIGWSTGYSLPGYLAFFNADGHGWNLVYLGMAVVMVVLMVFTLLVDEPVTQREALQKEAEQRLQEKANINDKATTWLTVTVIEPFLDFFRRNGTKVAVTLLLFVFLFKIGEAFLGRMSIVFYKEIGFSNEQIAEYSKLLGWGTTTLFTFVGSMFNVRFGIVRGLMIGGIAMASSNLMFAWLASVGPNEDLLIATILVDNFTTAFSTIAFVSFLTTLTGQAFSATQYALLASLGNLGRTTLSSFSGSLVDFLDSWPLFFIVTALMVIPSLVMLYSLRHYFNNLLNKARNQS